MRRAVPLCLVLAAALAGCEREEWDIEEVDYDLVEVADDQMLLTRGSVGVGRFESQASYLLVDARNASDEDLMVTLGGHLVDEQDKEVAELRPQSLRVPAGGVRLFSLIHEENEVSEEAVRAEVEVRGAMKVGYEPPVVVKDGRVDIDQDRAVVAANVVNTADRRTRVVVFAAFYDEEGAPMKQSSTTFRIDAESKRGTQFVGPEGSRRASMFIGKAVY